MKIFKNKFFIILLAIAIFASILTATLSVMGVKDPVKNLANTISVPFRYVGIKIKESFEGFSKYFTAIEKLDEENQQLREEIKALKSQLADAKATEEENERFREYLDIKKTYKDLEFVEGLIIGSGSDNCTTFFTLNKGETDGIKIGMPIIVKEGLVGSVCEVGDTWCRVRTLPESSSSVGAYISRSGEVGLVEGDISLKDEKTCALNYLSEDADVEIGDLVYTSGEGGIYPRDLYIGQVVSVETNEYLRTKTATISLSVEFKDLKYVLIVTGFGDSEE